MNSDDLPAVIVFDNIPDAVHWLVQHSVLAGKVREMDRPSLIPTMVTTEISSSGLPITAWSTGEQVMWGYLASLAGMGTTDLYEVANFFRGSGYALRIVAAFVSVMGLAQGLPTDEGGMT